MHNCLRTIASGRDLRRISPDANLEVTVLFTAHYDGFKENGLLLNLLTE